MALKPKQEKFCLAFARSGNITQAYIEAGYKSKSDNAAHACGSRLLQNDMVQNRLRELAEQAANEKIADVKEMQQVLTGIIRREVTEEIIVSNDNGIQRVRKEPALKDVVSAIEKLGKMQGAFTEKIDITGAIPVVICGEDDLQE